MKTALLLSLLLLSFAAVAQTPQTCLAGYVWRADLGRCDNPPPGPGGGGMNIACPASQQMTCDGHACRCVGPITTCSVSLAFTLDEPENPVMVAGTSCGRRELEIAFASVMRACMLRQIPCGNGF